MTTPLASELVNDLWRSLRYGLRQVFEAIDDRRFETVEPLIDPIRGSLDACRNTPANKVEDRLNDLYVLDRYLDFALSYGKFWHQVVTGEFSQSWNTLQDALDYLRSIKRFSRLDVGVFEHQLAQLEGLYPYKIFFSIDATIRRFDCSLCGSDIDGEECPHARNHLYGGRLAYGIARDIVQLNSVSLVLNPEDKRCVMLVENTSAQFKLVRFLSELISSGNCRPLEFGHLETSPRRQPNPEFRKLARNTPCFCGSGKKFKRCCVAKEYIDGEHIQIVPVRRSVNEVLK